MSGLKVYIAGPMRGYEGHNFPAFNAAAAKWRKNPAVSQVFNPAQMDTDDGFDPKTTQITKQNLRDFMTRDLGAILQCDSIVMLHGWEHSDGARVEHALAVYLGLFITYES